MRLREFDVAVSKRRAEACKYSGPRPPVLSPGCSYRQLAELFIVAPSLLSLPLLLHDAVQRADKLEWRATTPPLVSAVAWRFHSKSGSRGGKSVWFITRYLYIYMYSLYRVRATYILPVYVLCVLRAWTGRSGRLGGSLGRGMPCRCSSSSSF